MSNESYVVHIDGGRRCDIATTQGADTFLQAYRVHPQGFISAICVPQAQQFRRQLVANRNSGREEAVYRLMGVYHMIGFIADRCTPSVFDACVKDTEMKVFSDHALECIASFSCTDHWRETGDLEHQYDGEVLECIALLSTHKKFVRFLHQDVEGDGILSSLANVCRQRTPPVLVSAEFAHHIIRMVNNIIASCGTNLGMKREAEFRLVESTGILYQALRFFSIPQDNYHAHCIILDFLSSCPKLLSKKFVDDKPGRMIIDSIMEGSDGYAKVTSSALSDRIGNILQMDDLATPKDDPNDGFDIRCCRMCNKNGMDLGQGKKLNQCARCQAVYYCSKECQRADWKDHKKTCNTATKTPVSNRNVATDYVQRRKCAIISAIVEKRKELNGIPFKQLLLDIDFRPRIGEADSTSPALRGEMKIGVIEDYISGTDKPHWCECLPRLMEKTLKDFASRDMSTYLVVVCHHTQRGHAAVLRFQLQSPTTLQHLFANEVFEAVHDEDWSSLQALLGDSLVKEMKHFQERKRCRMLLTGTKQRSSAPTNKQRTL